MLTQLTYLADEVWDRWTVHKVALMTGLGRLVMPDGHWHAPSGEEPSLYLTFDDGPDPETTPPLLELLAEKDVPATFFLVGANCERYPHLVEAIASAGHRVGNHTYNHKLLPFLKTAQIEDEISRTNNIIEKITGHRPTIFRPPFGIMDGRSALCLAKENLTPVYWGSAPEDWLNPGSHRVIRRVMWKITDGTLIVLHEGSNLAGQTITAAKEIIYRCKSLGYQFEKVKVRA